MNEDTSVTRYLDQAGYRTGIIGKYLNNRDVMARPRYFDYFRVLGGGYWATEWNVNGRKVTVPAYSTKYMELQARRFIKRNDPTKRRAGRGKARAKRRPPWFLYVAVNAPHYPIQPEPLYFRANVGPFPQSPGTQEADISDKPAFVQDLAAQPLPPGLEPPTVRRGQLRTLLSVDDLLAGIRRTLAKTRQTKRTLVFFASDNGLLWGEHKIPTIKDLPYPEAARVPLMASWPGRIKSGGKDGRFTALIDIAPTILDAARIPPPQSPPMDGRSLLDRGWQRDRLLLEYFGLGSLIPPWQGIVRGDLQYTRYGAINGHPPSSEYYRTDDPFQLTNLLGNSNAGDDPSAGEIAQLEAQLNADSNCAGASCP
jgi:arylsulfatase A-like enzyme